MNSEDKDLPPKPHHPALWLVVIALNLAARVLCIAIAITEARALATRPNTVQTVLAVSTAAISLGSAAILFFRWRRERIVYRETIKFFCPRLLLRPPRPARKCPVPGVRRDCRIDAMKLDPRGPVLLVLGIYLILGSVYNWRMLIYGRGSHGTRTLFGEKGARWVYGVLGAVLLLLGVAGIIASFT